MALNIGNQIAALQRMTVGQLREQYEDVFGETTRAGNKDFLFKRIVWRLQSLAEGMLSERARQLLKLRIEQPWYATRDSDIQTAYFTRVSLGLQKFW